MTSPSTSCLLMRVAINETALLNLPSTVPIAWIRDFLLPLIDTLGNIFIEGFFFLNAEIKV